MAAMPVSNFAKGPASVMSERRQSFARAGLTEWRQTTER
jgi:hypothetical protein